MTYQLSYGYNELWIKEYFVTGYYSEGDKFQFVTINGVEVMEVDSTASDQDLLHALNWAVDTYIVGGNDDTPTTDPTEDGDQDDEPTPSTGFEVVYGGEVNGAGGLDYPRVVIYSERASFEAQNPNWQELIDDAFQSSPYTNLGDIYLSFRPTGGYEIYPRQGATRADGTQAEIW